MNHPTKHLSKHLSVPPENIARLAVLYSIDSPRGYSIKAHGLAICSVDTANGKELYTLSNDRACSMRLHNESETQILIGKAQSQRINSTSYPEIKSPDDLGWISADYMREHQWEMFNVISNCEFIFGVAGSGYRMNTDTFKPEEFTYEAGEIVSLMLHLSQPSKDEIAFVRYKN